MTYFWYALITAALNLAVGFWLGRRTTYHQMMRTLENLRAALEGEGTNG